jgi:hypothetical protein
LVTGAGDGTDVSKYGPNTSGRGVEVAPAKQLPPTEHRCCIATTNRPLSTRFSNALVKFPKYGITLVYGSDGDPVNGNRNRTMYRSSVPDEDSSCSLRPDDFDCTRDTRPVMFTTSGANTYAPFIEHFTALVSDSFA